MGAPVVFARCRRVRRAAPSLRLVFLEAGAPLTVLGAQAIYISQPFLGGEKTNALAHMLEEENETQAFIRYLRGEDVK